jgi:hypothetical protein
MRTHRHWALLLAGLIVLSTLAPGVPAYALGCTSEIENTPETCRDRYYPPRPVHVALPQEELPVDQSTVPFTVGVVITSSVGVYTHPADYYAGIPPAREFPHGHVWVSILSATEFNGEKWYLINANEYVRADYLAIYRPSRFQGVQLVSQPTTSFAFVLYWLRPSATAGADPDPAADAYNRYDIVTIYERQSLDGVTWYRVADNQWLPQKAVGVITPSYPPGRVAAGDKWIDVNLYEQTLAAYEGERMVFATLVSTGLKQWPTEPGLFRIWAKLEVARMYGREDQPDGYDLEDVPWTMYFDGDRALHGAYWHDSFGYPRSHGCVNMSPLDSKWLFAWTSPPVPEGLGEYAIYPDEQHPGTWVWVH